MKRAIVGTGLALSLGAILLATELPTGFFPIDGGSAALAELAARSPGNRVGGIALKAKSPRAALAPISADDSPRGAPVPEGPLASVLAAPATPEAVVPGAASPSEFLPPSAPVVAAGPGAGVVPDFGSVPLPSPGGLALLPPGGGGGGGGGGGILTPPTETIPVPGPTGTVPVVPGIPEPSTWLMLIAGFGCVGSAMRRRRRAFLA
jgi:hypothetical protein